VYNDGMIIVGENKMEIFKLLEGFVSWIRFFLLHPRHRSTNQNLIV
jgi:hypothetical protein